MTVADQTEGHRARCLPHLLQLRMLASDTPEAAFPWLSAGEVTQAMQAILAEVEAEVRVTAEGGPAIGMFLGVRLTRLATAADEAIAAAWAGDFAQLRRHLRRFETLTSAIWTVQDRGLLFRPRAVEVEHPDPGCLQALVHHGGDPLEQLVSELRVDLALAAQAVAVERGRADRCHRPGVTEVPVRRDEPGPAQDLP